MGDDVLSHVHHVRRPAQHAGVGVYAFVKRLEHARGGQPQPAIRVLVLIVSRTRGMKGKTRLIPVVVVRRKLARKDAPRVLINEVICQPL